MIGAKSFEKAELKVVNNRQGMWAALNHSLVVALGANGTELATRESNPETYFATVFSLGGAQQIRTHSAH